MSDRQQKINKLRAFLKRSTNNGGIYLISGQRGAGKTWLVDQALYCNDHESKKNSWSDYLSGRIGRRPRYSDIREPRYLARIYLKVDVDPMLPIESENHDKTSDIGDEFTHYTHLLLLNICFALTNTIDSRFSIRQHGRVLRERLGFFRYWFGNALLWPGEKENISFAIRTISAMSILQVSIWFIFELWRETGCCSYKIVFASVIALLPWLVLHTIKKLSWWHLLLAELSILAWLEYQLYPVLSCELRILLPIFMLLMPILCWVFLRWQDWLALQKISVQLYDLAHAYDYQQDHDETQDKQFESKLDLSLVISLLVLIGLIWFVPEELLRKLHVIVTAFFTTHPEITFENFKNILQTLPAILLLTLFYYRARKTHDGRHTKFDK